MECPGPRDESAGLCLNLSELVALQVGKKNLFEPARAGAEEEGEHCSWEEKMERARLFFFFFNSLQTDGFYAPLKCKPKLAHILNLHTTYLKVLLTSVPRDVQIIGM